MVRKTQQTGETITYVYDPAGRMLRREYRTLANSPAGAISDQDEFTYDAAGRMLTAVKGRYSNTVGRTYDEVGRPTSESLTIGGQTYTVSAAYGVTSPTITLTYPDESVVVKTLNSRGLLASVTRNGDDVVERTYTDAGRLATQTFGNGVVETWTWRNDGLVNSIAQPAGLFEYTYDANKNRTSEQITGPLADASWTTGTNGFDDDDRLTYRNQGNGDLVEQWDLSAVGDWNTFTENGTTTARTYGPTHEIHTVGPASLTHDSRGNLTTDEKGQLLAWDFDNQLMSVDTDADTNLDVQYVFDALSRRVARKEWDYVPTTPTSATEVYPHWQHDIAADYAAGATASAPLCDYVHGTRIDELLCMVDHTATGAVAAGTDERFYYHADAVTSVRALSDASGDPVEFYRYGCYGEPMILDDMLGTLGESAINNRYLFTAREWDSSTSGYYYRTRFVLPSIGQFVRRDDMAYVDGGSLYAAHYCPHTTDPMGLCASCAVEFFQVKTDPPFFDKGAPPQTPPSYYATITALAKFVKPCDCCRFLQCASGSDYIIVDDGPNQQGRIVDRTDRDWSDDGYGVPGSIATDDNLDGYGINGDCTYGMRDKPGMTFPQGSLLADKVCAKYGAKRSVTYVAERLFTLQIIDTCNNNTIVAGPQFASAFLSLSLDCTTGAASLNPGKKDKVTNRPGKTPPAAAKCTPHPDDLPRG